METRAEMRNPTPLDAQPNGGRPALSSRDRAWDDEDRIKPTMIDVEAIQAADPGRDVTETFGTGSYIDFALALIATAAEDIAYAQKEFAKHQVEQHLNPERQGKIQFMLDSATGWLEGFEECIFSFRECTWLLVDELRLQSLGNVSIPEIDEQPDLFADWIMAHPEKAAHVLMHYRQIFASDNRECEDDALMNDSEKATNKHFAPRQRFRVG